MKYNLIAGTNLERLCAIGDGLFAVAMTSLVLDSYVPEAGLHSEADLLRTLGPLSLRLIPYFLDRL